MNTRSSLTIAILLAAGLSVQAQQGAKEDIKQAGHEVKKAGKADWRSRQEDWVCHEKNNKEEAYK